MHPGKPQGSQGDNRGQVGSQPSPDACPVEGASVPIRRSGCWEDSGPRAGRGEPAVALGMSSFHSTPGKSQVTHRGGIGGSVAEPGLDPSPLEVFWFVCSLVMDIPSCEES